MMVYRNRASLIRFARPCTKISLVSASNFVCGIILILLHIGISNIVINNEFISKLKDVLNTIITVFISCSLALAVLGVILFATQSKCSKIKCMVRKGLFAYQYGNPLHLKEGEVLPQVKCRAIDEGIFELLIYTRSIPLEEIQKLAPNISSILNKRFSRYAVTIINSDISGNYVSFRLEDVAIDKSLIFRNVNEMKPKSPAEIEVQRGTSIDLTTSGSILVAGKTRSGKTTGIISLLIQALLCGRDTFNSCIFIIDPKRAELSVLPHVVTVDDDGEARAILEAMKRFAEAVTERQRILNDKSLNQGDAVHWWEIGMHPSFLFIDEYVACRSLFPRKAEKDSDYCLTTFDALIKRIVTMGASAGCYVIISIAEASVEEAGLPSMLKNACSTKILFRPTLNEGRLIWESDKLSAFPSRVYKQGDAWFSSTDGIHDDVCFAHFPRMDFPVYQELGSLLREYYRQ